MTPVEPNAPRQPNITWLLGSTASIALGWAVSAINWTGTLFVTIGVLSGTVGAITRLSAWMERDTQLAADRDRQI